ncbi:hypothetical protein E2562_006991 [Oryza meyeriana var. granulata]|uniref:Uncharacterized protein n=1 Tax=Oryza meyeriana var. granulata TaxID=110450 RepID=A0A6G1E8J4_9ORYZ|nr:hypothetical protein E2562_006991 [Oryza meyeriana var. granulata]
MAACAAAVRPGPLRRHLGKRPEGEETGRVSRCAAAWEETGPPPPSLVPRAAFPLSRAQQRSTSRALWLNRYRIEGGGEG